MRKLLVEIPVRTVPAYGRRGFVASRDVALESLRSLLLSGREGVDLIDPPLLL